MRVLPAPDRRQGWALGGLGGGTYAHHTPPAPRPALSQVRRALDVQLLKAWSLCRVALLRGDASVALRLAIESSRRDQPTTMRLTQRTAQFHRLELAVETAYAAIAALDTLGRTTDNQTPAQREACIRSLCGDHSLPGHGDAKSAA